VILPLKYLDPSEELSVPTIVVYYAPPSQSTESASMIGLSIL